MEEEILSGNTYTWETNTITFYKNGMMQAFGVGRYRFIDPSVVIAAFGDREHVLVFNAGYSLFTSVRKGDGLIVRGRKIDVEYERYNDTKEKMIQDIHNIILKSNEILEGNSFYQHQTLNILPELYAKQTNLFQFGKKTNTRICEIGFNAGHSTMLMLLGREKTACDYTIFDIGEHAYTRPCYEYLKNVFSHIQFELQEGDSTVTMPEWIRKNPDQIGTYDLIHVDGGHTEHCISNDMKNSDILAKVGCYIIIDDTNIPYINYYVDQYISSGKYKEVEINKTIVYPHRIIQKIA
jgi:hypothetical protein